MMNEGTELRLFLTTFCRPLNVVDGHPVYECDPWVFEDIPRWEHQLPGRKESETPYAARPLVLDIGLSDEFMALTLGTHSSGVIAFTTLKAVDSTLSSIHLWLKSVCLSSVVSEDDQ